MLKAIGRNVLVGFLVFAVSEIATVGQQNDQSPLLVLTTEVMKARYCEWTERQATLRMSLRLVFKNNGRTPVIFSRLLLVGGSEIRSLAENPRVWSPLTTVEDHLAYPSNSAPGSSPGGDFVVLKPGKTFVGHKTISVAFLLRDPPARDERGPGDYSISLSIPTWWGSERAASLARERWKKYGHLETEGVKSEPMKFDIEKDPAIEHCKRLPQQ